MQSASFFIRFIPVICAVLSTALAPGEVAVKPGQKIAFLGDSITEGGWGNPAGYVRLVLAGLATNGIKVTSAPAGISGHKSNQMLERLDRDVLSKKPDWMTLSCGVNDVWHGANGVPLPQYQTNIASIVEQAQAAGIRVMLLTSTPIGEDLDNTNNLKLVGYNDYLRSLAREKKCLLADLNADFQAKLNARPAGSKGNLLTSDGVHMNPVGNRVMAAGILRAFGFDQAQMKKAEAAWKDIFNGATLSVSFDDGTEKRLQGNFSGTMRQQEKLERIAAGRGKKYDQLLESIFAEESRKFLKPEGEFDSVQAIYDAKKEQEVQATLQKQFNRRVQQLLKD